MNITIQSGDVVRLKSGGPAMTVARLGSGSDSRGQEAFCRWFTLLDNGSWGSSASEWLHIDALEFISGIRRPEPAPYPTTVALDQDAVLAALGSSAGDAVVRGVLARLDAENAAGQPEADVGAAPITFDITGEALADIPPGLYELEWKNGARSLAAVGMRDDGTRWFAPCDWATGPAGHGDWDYVRGAVAIRLVADTR